MLQGPINEHVKKIISAYIKDAMMATTTDVSDIIQNHSEVMYLLQYLSSIAPQNCHVRTLL
jgi:hypothetical protein